MLAEADVLWLLTPFGEIEKLFEHFCREGKSL